MLLSRTCVVAMCLSSRCSETGLEWHRCTRPFMMAETSGTPSIQALAARQAAVVLLQENWKTISELLGGLLSGTCVQAGPSPLHGIGVFAAQDIPEGELVVLHPVDRILQQLSGGKVAGALADDVDAEYFRPSDPGISSEELSYRQIAYRKIYSHIDPQRPERFFLDANPLKPDTPAWLGHRINDGAILAPGATDEEVKAYYTASAATRNIVTVALCVPLLGFVTTKPIPAGAELTTTYGHTYWMQSAAPVGPAANDEFATFARETDLWQVSCDKKYRKYVQALEDFVAKAAEQVEA